MKQSERIPCAVCRDLLPLVADQVASPESEALVREHLEICPDCRLEAEVLGQGFPALGPDPDKGFSALRRRVAALAILLLIIGSCTGIALSNSMGVFYNFLLMPASGILGFYLLRKKCFFVPLGVGAASWIWTTGTMVVENGDWKLLYLTSSLAYPLIFAILSAIGCLIGFLLWFAFKKEETHEKR